VLEGPLAGHEFAVPTKDRGWGDDEPRPAIPWDEPGERREHDPVASCKPRPWVRPLQHAKLVSKDEDLRFALSLIVIGWDLEERSKDEVADGEEHRAMIQSPRSEGRSMVSDPFRLRQLADAGAIECFKTSLGRVYRTEDLDRLSAAGWSRRQPVPKLCSSIDCKAIALDAWEYMVVPGVEIQISLCASHIVAVVTRRR
jgi:hypothetical protein